VALAAVWTFCPSTMPATSSPSTPSASKHPPARSSNRFVSSYWASSFDKGH